MQSINMLCFPFAGGNKYSFREFLEKAPSFLNVIVFEYPGRGARAKEPLLTDIDMLVNDMLGVIRQVVGRQQYVLYGHSMGGLMACLLARKIILEGLRRPLHMLVTGTIGPAAESRKDNPRHLLDKQQFLEELEILDGSPKEILKDEEMFDYFEPILRADFKACETYVYKKGDPLPIPLTVITGFSEDYLEEEIRLWQLESCMPVDFQQMPGGHFFIYDWPEKILEILSKKVMRQHIT